MCRILAKRNGLKQYESVVLEGITRKQAARNRQELQEHVRKRKERQGITRKHKETLATTRNPGTARNSKSHKESNESRGITRNRKVSWRGKGEEG